jgi:hypothetical protein
MLEKNYEWNFSLFVCLLNQSTDGLKNFPKFIDIK